MILIAEKHDAEEDVLRAVTMLCRSGFPTTHKPYEDAVSVILWSVDDVDVQILEEHGLSWSKEEKLAFLEWAARPLSESAITNGNEELGEMLESYLKEKGYVAKS